MAEAKGKKKRLSINLSFLTLTDSTKRTSPHKSIKIFEEPNGVVGLGILAALNDHHHHHQDQDPVFINGCRTAVLAISPKSSSNPIPILTKKTFFSKSSNNSSKNLSAEEMELCEGYTCVISHVGQKKEYFEADFLGKNNGSERVCVVTGNSGGSGSVSQSATAFEMADFLSSCFLCHKLLHGLDIFMYRGDKAFCSTECRLRQISIDEQKEKRHSGVRKSMEYSVSPLQFLAGVAAA